MSKLTEFAAKGTLVAGEGQQVIFNPRDTVYQLQLRTLGPVAAEPLGNRGLIRIQARKVYTVPSGGNFISPIVGPPRLVQGRVKYLDDKTLVVQAGVPVVVELPGDPAAFALARGPLAVGQLVNVAALPGAIFDPNL